MTDMDTLLEMVDSLSPDEIKRLYTHILENHIQFVNEESQGEPHFQRIIGLHENAGEFWMSEDFDDELPDSFWLGEE